MQPQEYAGQRTAVARPAALEDEALMDSAAVRRSCGNVSSMCLWRWTRDPRVKFPVPDVVINTRNYWYASTIRRWKAERATKVAA